MLKILYTLRWLLFPLGFVLAAWLLVDLSDPKDWKIESIDWRWISIAFMLNLIYVTFYGNLWHNVTQLHNIIIPRNIAITTYLYSNLGKYVPFKIAGIAYRIVIYAQKFNCSPGLVLRACYVETILALLAGVVIGMVLFPFTDGLGYVVQWYWYILIGFVLFILLMKKTQKIIFTIIFRLMKKELPEPSDVRGGYTLLLLKYSGAWLVLGLSLYFLCLAVNVQPSFFTLLMVTEIYILAGVTGILVFFIPSGIGVREGVMLLGLSIIMPASDAAFVTLLARVSITLAEMSGALVSFLYLEFPLAGKYILSKKSFENINKMDEL